MTLEAPPRLGVDELPTEVERTSGSEFESAVRERQCATTPVEQGPKCHTGPRELERVGRQSRQLQRRFLHEQCALEGNGSSVEIEADLLAETAPVVGDLSGYERQDSGGNLVLNFGAGNTLTFSGVGTLAEILDDITLL
jgi:hypothetical protein